MTDFDLLRSYASSGSEDDFASLVGRYANLVYSAALRQTRDCYEAEEISQVVFIILARKAGTIRKETVLSGWLLRTTRLVALNASRRQARRRRTELEAASTFLTETEAAWTQIVPFLDEALVSLSDKDRDAVILRFFEQKSFKEIGEILGTSDDNAQKRVSRALVKLRSIYAKRGAVVPSTIFAAAITANAVEAAPSHLIASAITALTSSSAAAGSISTLTKATLSALNEARRRTAGVRAAGVLLALVVALALHLFTRTVKPSSTASRTNALSQPGPASPVGGNLTPVVADLRQLRLRVIDSQTEAPIRNARITATWGSLPRLPTNLVVTDNLGECLISFKPTKEEYWNFLIQILRDGYVPRFVSWAEARGDIIQDIPAEYSVRLTHGQIIGGIVFDKFGEPIPNTEIHLNGPGPNLLNPGPPEREGVAIPHSETTDTLGRWLCNHVPPQFEAIRFSFSHPDFAAAIFGVAKLRSISSSQLSEEDLRHQSAVVTLKAGLVVTGMVADEHGRPIVGAKVFRDHAWYSEPTETTGLDGRFRIGNAADGELTLTVQADGFVARDTTLRPAGNTNELRFQLARAAVLRGKVVDESGKSIVKAFIGATGGDFDSGRFQWGTPVDETGGFEWLSAPPSHKRYNVQASGYKSLTGLELDPDGTEHVIPLERGANRPRFRIAGNVVDAETGQPLHFFEVWVATTLGPDGIGPEARIAPELHTTGIDGRFAFLPRKPGGKSYAVEIRSQCYLPARETVPGPLTTDQRLNFTLRPAPALTGVALLPDGKAASGAVVLLCSDRGDCASFMLPGQLDLNASCGTRVQTESNGDFILPTTTPTGTVFVVHNSGYSWVPIKQLAASRIVTLRPWGRVEGLLIIGGKPGVDETVYLNNAIPEQTAFLNIWLTSTTDAEGHFVFEGVPPGEVRLASRLTTRDHHKDSAPSNRSLTIQVSSDHSTRVVLGGVGRKLVGRIQESESSHRFDWQEYTVTLITQFPGLPSPSRNQFDSATEYAQALQVWRRSKSDFERTALGREVVRNSQEYSALLQADGTFTINDVIQGTYELEIVGKSEAAVTLGALDAVKRTRFDGLVREVVVPESSANDGRPLDLGVWEITLKGP